MVGSHALAHDVGKSRARAVDRQVTVASLADVAAVDSFFRRRVQHDSMNDIDRELSLWGIQAKSSVPLLDAHARFDYSVYMPSDSNTAVLADEEHRMLRMSLRDRHRFVSFGGSLFTVGDMFVHQPLAREQLDSTGLNAPGDGTELWATGHLPFWKLESTYRRVDVADELANTDLERTTSTTILGLRRPIPTGSVFLRNVRFEEQPGNQAEIYRTRWELGGNVSPFRHTTVSPIFAVEQQFNTERAMRASSMAGVNVHTRLADATVLNLRLHHDRHEMLVDHSLRGSVAADLGITTPLKLWARTPPGLTVSANVGYRELLGVPETMPEEGMSVRLSFNFQAGG
jgi:hypothetical protein